MQCVSQLRRVLQIIGQLKGFMQTTCDQCSGSFVRLLRQRKVLGLEIKILNVIVLNRIVHFALFIIIGVSRSLRRRCVWFLRGKLDFAVAELAPVIDRVKAG